jgi:hypothetical protein
LVRVFVAALAVVTCRAALACIDYEPAMVTLQGTLMVRAFPGPPNYESAKRGDREEWAALLELPQPICANAVPGDPLRPADADVPTVHLVAVHAPIPRSLRNKPVTVTGSIFHSFTGHHRSKLLLNVETIHATPESGR